MAHVFDLVGSGESDDLKDFLSPKTKQKNVF